MNRELTAEMKDGARGLIEALDSHGVEVAAALWFLFPEFQNWKLILSLPELIEEGPRVAYRAVQKAYASLAPHAREGFPIDSVTVATTHAPIISALGTVVRTGRKEICGVRCTNNRINGEMIEDAYVYRLSA